MLDFPATPATGQLYNGTNGVTYRWNGTIWVATGASTGGDFSASGANDQNIGSGGQIVTFATVLTGNTGGWWNTGTNRYTPPAGRYSLIATGYLWNSSGSTGSYTLTIRKNGVKVWDNTATCVVGTAMPVAVAVTVDANGADYFDVHGYGAAGTPRIYAPYFEAFPLSGIKGAPGDPGVTPDIPQNSQTGNYTLVLSDAGKHIYHPSGAAAAAYTIPANASVAFNIGAAVTFVNDSANNVTIPITTDTLVLSPAGTTGTRTLAQYGMATALKVTATRWVISGTGLT